jgi:hypothetical protein
MNADPNVFVFISPDGSRFALTRIPDGTNLPHDYHGAWIAHDVVPMTLAGIEKYSADTAAAMVDLIMRGFHVVPRSSNVIDFPPRRRSS